VAETAQKVVVMYAGRKVEQATVEDLFEQPLHPYTRGLMQSIPSTNKAVAGDTGTLLHEIPGVVPNLRDPIAGCAFAERCHMAEARCREAYPPLNEYRPEHFSACWRADELMGTPLAESAGD